MGSGEPLLVVNVVLKEAWVLYIEGKDVLNLHCESFCPQHVLAPRLLQFMSMLIQELTKAGMVEKRKS